MQRITKNILLFFLILSPIFVYGLIISQNEIKNDKSNIIDQIDDEEGMNFHTDTTIISFDGKIIGMGLPANVSLNCNKSGTPLSLDSGSTLDISTPNPWTIIYTNITVTDIIQDLDIVIMEDSITSNLEDIKDNEYAMQFNVTNHALLENFSIYVHNVREDKINSIITKVYNATSSGTDPEPDKLLYNQTYFNLGANSDDQWLNFTFSSAVELDPSGTYNNAFFISLLVSVGGGGYFEWGYELDSGGDDGAAYSPTWVLESWDFNLKVGLINISRHPSEIDLEINGTSVSDKNESDGEWISTVIYSDISGLVSFEFSANISAHFMAEWFVSYQLTADQDVNTYFEGFDNDVIIYWNATYGATFITDSFDKQLDFDLPIWKSVMNVRKNESIHAQWNSIIVGSIRRITISNAENALWTIQCNDTNYVEKVYAKRSGVIVSEVNGTDTIDIFGNLTEIMTSGDANLTIFPSGANYNDTEGEGITNNKTIKFSPAWELMNTSTASYTQARLQISWFNGTAAGINTTTLTVKNIPTKLTYLNHTTGIQSGESIFAYVNFSNDYTGEGLAGADLLVKNSTDNTTWPAPFSIIDDYLNGTYKIEILSLGVGSGVHYFSINLSKPIYLSSEVSDLSVTIGGGISNVSVTAPNCIGLDPINQSYALANPAPYHNSTVRVTIYYFDDLTLAPLSNGIITPSWIGGGPAVAWVNAFFGYYNITIDVTGFRAGTNHTLRISIQEAGYVAAELNIIVPIRKLPTVIEPFESSYAKYLEETFIVYAVFKDIFNDQSIPSIYELNGNFTIRIGNLVDNMTLLISGMGIYLYELTLSTLGLEEGNTYNITLFAFSSEHESALINVSLYIIPKASVNLNLIGVPVYVLAGTQIRIFANLTLVDGTPIYSTPLTFTIHYEFGNTSQEFFNVYLTNSSGMAESVIDVNPDMDSIQIMVEYQGNVTVQNRTTISTVVPIIILNSSLTLSQLPNEIMEGETLELNATLLINGSAAADKLIFFTFKYEGSDREDVRTAGTDATGTASVGINVPSGVSKIYIYAEYKGVSYVNSSTIESEIIVISIMTLVWRYSPIWLSIIAFIAGITMTYKYGYKRRKLRRLRAIWQKSANKFRDAANLNFLMVVLKQTGASIYNYSFKGQELDYALASGFLAAISTFQGELLKLDEKGALETEEWEINYHKFKIYGVSRELVQLVLILDDSPSEEMKMALLNFGRDVELVYTAEFKKFRGNVKVFKPIDSVVRKYFDAELVFPYVIAEISKKEYNQLSPLERKLYGLGRSFCKEQGYFYFTTLLESALMISKLERNQILDSVYNLIEKKLFKAITVEDIQKTLKIKPESLEQPPPRTPKSLKQPPPRTPESLEQTHPETHKILVETLQKLLRNAKTAEEKNYLSMAIDQYQRTIPILEEMNRNDQIIEISKRIEALREKQTEEIEK
ncbi:MAG: hypothetical protein HWN65_17975 [Candidatus Helarchaeota archaeon]|nr:hypothetical protein [Candidatus Helarchaeota archaeon]